MENEKPKLTVNIKSVYGSLHAYPSDDFMRQLLHLKDRHMGKQVIREAQCFTAYDIRWLKEIAEELGAELVEEFQHESYQQRWQKEKETFNEKNTPELGVRPSIDLPDEERKA